MSGRTLGNGVYEMLKCIYEELKKKNTPPDMEKITYCDPATDTLWIKYCEYVYDEVTDTRNLQEILRENLGVPCDAIPPQVDIEKIRRCDPTTGTIRIDYCRFVTIVNEDDSVASTTDEIIKQIDTGEKCVCDPMIKSFTADAWATEAEEFTSIGIKKPECCVVTVITTKGEFTLYEGDLGFDSSEFGCPIEITDIQITGGCSLADVKIFIQRK